MPREDHDELKSDLRDALDARLAAPSAPQEAEPSVEQRLRETLRLHGLWLRDEPGGRRADLRGADLRGADLRDADLRDAVLRGAVLHEGAWAGEPPRGVVGRWWAFAWSPDRVQIGCTTLAPADWLGPAGERLREREGVLAWEAEGLRAIVLAAQTGEGWVPAVPPGDQGSDGVADEMTSATALPPNLLAPEPAPETTSRHAVARVPPPGGPEPAAITCPTCGSTDIDNVGDGVQALCMGCGATLVAGPSGVWAMPKPDPSTPPEGSEPTYGTATLHGYPEPGEWEVGRG